MANGNQDNIVDIDPLLTPEFLSRVPDAPQPAMTTMNTQLPYMQDDSDNIIKNNIKNYLVNQGVNKNTIDTLVGAPGSWRDRFFTTLPGTNLKVPALGRIFNPDFDGINVARDFYDIEVRKSAPTDVLKDSQYLPADSYFYGVQGLLKEQYPNVAIKDFSVKKDPVTDRLTYIDPDSGKRRYVNAPGLDYGDFKSFIEPMIVDILGGGLGLMSATKLEKTDPKARAAVGAGVGATVLAGLELGTDLPTGATLPSAISAGLVTYKYPYVGLTATGTATAHMIWRYNNLQGLKERGLLTPEYTDEKILQDSLKESGMVGLMELGGATAFTTVGRLFGGNPLDVLPGTSYDEFVEAFEDIQKRIKDPKTPDTEKQILERLTTPEIASAAGIKEDIIPDTFLIRGQQKLEDVALQSSKQGKDLSIKFGEKDALIKQRYGEFFDQAGLESGVFQTFDPVQTKVVLGKNLYKTLGLENKNLNPQIRKLANESKKFKAEPENMFTTFYAPNKISVFKEVVKKTKAKKDTESLQLMKELAYDDFLTKTTSDGKFLSGKLDTYIRSHGNLMAELYGKEMVDGLKTYNTFIKQIDNGKFTVEGYPSGVISNIANTIARTYTGIFTVKGRILTAVSQGRGGLKENQYIKLLSEPEEMVKAIKSKGFYDDPDNLATLGFLSSGYYLNGKLTDKGELEDVPSLLPIDNIDLTELTEVKEED